VSQDKSRTQAPSRAPGDIAVAALLAAGALAERTRGHRAWLAAIPIIGVNFVAFYGQASFFRAHRHVQPGVVIPFVIADVMALALESIAVYLAWQAHLARKANDSAFRLRLGAYAVAVVIGALNYSHFCGPRWQPTAYAVAFALASVISPALWGIHSNRESRDALKARGLIEDHAVRLGATRWAWHLLRSARVMFRATWVGETNPARAIALIGTGPGREIVLMDEGLVAAEPAGQKTEPAAARPRKLASASAGQLMNGRGAGTGARSVTAAGSAAQAPPSAPGPAPREPRTLTVRAARAPELAAARAAAEQEMATELAHTPQPWPAARKLADDERLSPFGSLATRRRAAGRVVIMARTMSNGGGHGDRDGA
jgi:hypothetical protein